MLRGARAPHHGREPRRWFAELALPFLGDDPIDVERLLDGRPR
jgi:hypothetical protein